MSTDDNTDREALAKVIDPSMFGYNEDYHTFNPGSAGYWRQQKALDAANQVLAVLPSLGWVKADERTDQELADAYLGRPASINQDHVRRLRAVVGSAAPEEEP